MRGETGGPTTLADAVRARRTELGVSQRHVAERLGVSAAYMNDIEHGRREPNHDLLLEALARTLSMDPDYLFWLVGRLPPDVRGITDDPALVAHGLAVLREGLAGERGGRP